MMYRYFATYEQEEHTPNMQIVRETYETYQLSNLIEESHPGDTIVFTSILSLGSDPEKVYDIYSKLLAGGIVFTFTKHPYLNSNIFSASEDKSEIIRTLITQTVTSSIQNKKVHGDKVRKGLAVARSRGTTLGIAKGTKLTTKKSLLAKEIIRSENRQFGGLLTNEETAKKAGISMKTLYKYKREISAEKQASKENTE